MLLSSLHRIAPTRWGVGASLVILAAAGALKLYSGLMPEPVAIPNPPAPPSPNARDIYNRAEALLPKDDLERKIYENPSGSSLIGPPASTLPLQRQLVAVSQPAFEVLRQGLRCRYLSPPVRSYDTLLPYYAGDRDMARRLKFEGDVRTADGDWSGATNSYLDAIQLGASLQHGAILIGGLVGIACEAIGRRGAWSVVGHLTAPQAKAAAQRLAMIDSENVPWSSVLQEEKCSSQAGELKMFQKKNWRGLALGNFELNPDGSDTTRTIWQKLAVQIESPRVMFNNYTQYMTGEVRRSSLSWGAQKALPPLPLPTDPIVHDIASVLSENEFKPVISEALNNLLMTQLALRAYRLERGAYPATLNQLVPAYLPNVPIDPFSDGQTLRYRLQNGKPLLYSIGPDAVDDGGQPPPAKTMPTGEKRQFMQEGDTGDLLPGGA